MADIALFDLDNTLLNGDSDDLWNEFLVSQGLVDDRHYRRQSRVFYENYQQGKLDVTAYQRFQLGEMAKIPMETLLQARERYVNRVIKPIILPQGIELIQKHKNRGDITVIITATNRFITGPIAALFQVDTLIATEPQWRNDRLTGDIEGTPCYQHGKVERLRQWQQQNNGEATWFYSDSHNDLPLLEQVDHAFAVNPDNHLEDTARQRGWPVLDLRG